MSRMWKHISALELGKWRHDKSLAGINGKTLAHLAGEYSKYVPIVIYAGKHLPN